MQALRGRVAIGLWALKMGLTGCGAAQIARLEQRVGTLEQQLADDRKKNEVTRVALEEQIEFETRKLWGKMYCDSQQVRDFIKACESSDTSSCSEQGLAQALAFMGSQPWVSFWMRPKATGKDLHSVRQGQLAQLTDLRNTHPSTRFVVLVQPSGDDEPQRVEAQAMGQKIVQRLRSEYRVSTKATALGVHLLPCKLRSDQLKQYTRTFDQPKLGEPQADEPRIRVWVFRTDC